MSDNEFEVPVKRVEGETLEERMNENGYNDLLPARYQLKNEDGEIVEDQEEVFERVAKNIAVAEYVFEQDIDESHAPDISWEEIDTGEIWNKDFADQGDDEAMAHAQTWARKFQNAMENLKFIPNTPTIINAGDDIQQLSACISGDTPIYTEDGLKFMADISEGDVVLTHTGEFKEVTAHWSNGVKETVDVKRGISSGDNYNVTATPDHEFLTQEGEWEELGDIDSAIQPTASPDVKVPSKFNLTEYTSLMKKEKSVVNHKGLLRVENGDDPRTGRFDRQYSEIIASVDNNLSLSFLAGVYLAEGDIDGTDLRFTINSEADELQNRIVESLEELFDVHVAVTESSYGNWKTITASSPFISDFFLTQFGVGTTKKRIPQWVFAADENYQEALLEGLLVDGHDNGSSWKLTPANPTLAYEASLIARNLGYQTNFTLRAENKLSANDTSRVMISKDSEKTRFDNIVKREGEEVEVYDMEVEDDHSFVAGDFVVHNCFVDSPEDDMEDIGDTITEASLIFQSGGGCGYDFGKIRPYGDPVSSTGGIASGPLTFMKRFDQNCGTVAQGGVRRGAQMGTMPVTHPDVIHFLHAKNRDVSLAHTLLLNDPDDPEHDTFGEALEEARELITDDGRVPQHLRNAVEGHLSNFNISVTITDDFMEALQNGEEYDLINPRTGEQHIATEGTKEMYQWFGLGDEVEVGEPLSLPAEEIWDRVVQGAYDNGEPGVMYIDEVNREHSFDTKENPNHRMTTSNPCAEQNLEEYEACNLGHINLSTIVEKDVTPWVDYKKPVSEWTDGELENNVSDFLEQAIDWDELDERIEIGTRFLDNVVTMSDFPIEEISETVRNNRKIGLGVMGLAQLFIQLGVEYGSEEADEIARQLMEHINHESKYFSSMLASKRGNFNNWKDSKYANPTEYPEWFEKHVGEDPYDWEDGYPIRNHNTTTIAPTGSTSILGDTTGGCEPIYNVAYYKNVTDDVQGDEMLVEFDSLFLDTLEANGIDVEKAKREAEELMENNEFTGPESLETVPDEIAELFVTTSDLTPREHASVQCALQEGVDSSISKTVNAPNDATLEEAKDIFEYIYENGGKAVTFYRDGSRTKQVNTVRKDNQETDEGEEEEPEKRFSTVEPRERPKETEGETHRIDTPYGNLYVVINEDEYGPVEVFATVGKSGGNMESFTEALARQVSLTLRAGVHIDETIEQLENIRSPEVSWDNGDTIYSIPDGIATALKRYREDNTSDNDKEDNDMNHTTVVPENYDSDEKSGEPCPDCGEMMVFKEGCKSCPDPSCGYSAC